MELLEENWNSLGVHIDSSVVLYFNDLSMSPAVECDDSTLPQVISDNISTSLGSGNGRKFIFILLLIFTNKYTLLILKNKNREKASNPVLI